MMKADLNKLPTAIVSILLFCIGIALSCDVFAAKPLAIGDTGPGGGIVFHVTDDGKHGLEAAPSDQNGGAKIKWHTGDIIDTNAVKEGIFDGSFNTDRIVSAQGAGEYAALVCANYNGGGQGDWYLPSKDELNLMYSNLHFNGLGAFVSDNYWSSTEHDIEKAWKQFFGNGSPDTNFKSLPFSRVRAVRAF